jgi:diguanylate cyclase (GGDEF)-like protein
MIGGTMDTALTTDVVTARQMRPAQQFPDLDHESWCSSCGRPAADPLTGLLDRWQWTRHAVALTKTCIDAEVPAAVLLVDLDRFKSINDAAGHAAGDAILAAVAAVIRSATRANDLWGRYGSYAGDEFVGLLPGAGLPGAMLAARRLQDHVAGICVPVVTSLGAREIGGLSISVGLAAHAHRDRLEDTLARADMALMSAKRNGRNRIYLADATNRLVVVSKTHDDVRGCE